MSLLAVHVARTTDDVGVVVGNGFEEVRQSLGFMLQVAVHGNDPFVSTVRGVVQGGDNTTTVAHVVAVAQDDDVVTCGKDLPAAVSASIVDDEHIADVAGDDIQEIVEVLRLIVDRDRQEDFQWCWFVVLFVSHDRL